MGFRFDFWGLGNMWFNKVVQICPKPTKILLTFGTISPVVIMISATKMVFCVLFLLFFLFLSFSLLDIHYLILTCRYLIRYFMNTECDFVLLVKKSKRDLSHCFWKNITGSQLNTAFSTSSQHSFSVTSMALVHHTCLLLSAHINHPFVLRLKDCSKFQKQTWKPSVNTLWLHYSDCVELTAGWPESLPAFKANLKMYLFRQAFWLICTC